MLRPITRTLSFFTEWAAEVARQPMLILLVVVGPFLVLFAFGKGVSIAGPPPRVILVEPEGAPGLLRATLEESDDVVLLDVTADLEAARARLSRSEVDAVVIVPEDPGEFIARGERAPIRVFSADIDPVRLSYSRLFLGRQVDRLNQLTVSTAIAEAADAAGSNPVASRALGDARLPTSDPALLSAPYVLDVRSGLSYSPSFTTFYAASVVALITQHIAITLAALSMVRLRAYSISELIRVAPVRTAEVVIGNYLSYGTLTLLACAAFVAALVGLLGVPLFGPPLLLAAGLFLLTFVSLGIGFAISILARSEHQAAQGAMLVLLASVFLSGFAFSLDRIEWPVRAISYALPVTYGIQLVQDVMLRGYLRNPLDLVLLGVAGCAFFGITLALLRREFRPR